MTRRRLAAVSAVLLLVASAGFAQRRGRAGATFPILMPDAFNGGFLFCRIAFRNQPAGDGGGWSVDYPRADMNLPFRLSELTKTPVSRDALGQINHIVIRLTDPQLYQCPFVMMTEPGGAYFDDAEAGALRTYLQKGGFLWADDFWGTRAWQTWAGEIAKALPPGEYPIVDVPLEHDLFHTLYDVRAVPQVPSITFWAFTGGRTSERGADSAVPHVRAIFDAEGRIMVLMTHNTDFGDAFEREGDNHEYFLEFAPPGYAFGVNTLLYAMTH
ncbi:MAG: DUF4159 domain-containing protein [Acidobacteriota bacterium]